MKNEEVENNQEKMRFIYGVQQYNDELKIKVAQKRADLAVQGVMSTQAQTIYMLVTNSTEIPTENIPKGEKLKYDFLDEDEVCYEIKDDSVANSDWNPEYYKEHHNFCGTENDNEKHYITSKGRIIVLPGFKVVRDNGEVVYYVNDEDSYKK